MKKMLIIQIYLFICISAISNPVAPEPTLFVSEIFFEGDDWIIEIVGSSSIHSQSYYLDNVIFETWSDQSYFKPGIKLEAGEIILITKDSLVTPVSIDKYDDVLNIKECEPGTGYIEWEINGIQNINFGNCNSCGTPYDGQSLVMQYFELEYPGAEYDDIFYWIVNEKTPTLGSDPFTCNSRDTVSGYVYDKFLKPIGSARIKYCSDFELFTADPDLLPIITNEDGYFKNTSMFSKNYGAYIILGDSIISYKSFNVEIDSSNIYNFIIEDYVHTGIEMYELTNSISLANYPNPVSDQTTISINIPQNCKFKNAVIKIFNISGQIVEIIPIIYNGNNIYKITWNRNNNIADGEYYYCLDIDYKKVASNIMMIVK